MIEVELRTFVSAEQFEELRRFLSSQGRQLEHVRQITHYLDHPVDTRIQLSTEDGRLWQKLGKMHDKARQELEVTMPKQNAETILGIFRNLGFAVKVTWYRERRAYRINEITVSLDDTIGYGRILEAEILCADEEADSSYIRLKSFFRTLGLTPSDGKEFDQAFAVYLETWNEKTAHLDDKWINANIQTETN
jgi:predicted adenylyl cyclase CyaB